MTISPDWAYGLSLGAKLEMFKKNYMKSIKYLDKYFRSTQSEKEYDYGYVLIKLNKIKEAKSLLEREEKNYLDEIESSPNGSGSNENNLANIYAILGNKQKALLWLNKAVSKGWIEYRQNIVYPYMDSLKSDKEFQSLIKLMKANTESIKVLAINEDPDWDECD